MRRSIIKGKRVTKLTLSIGSARLVVSLRRFRTQKTHRAKGRRQLVIRLYGLPFREAALAWKFAGRRRKKFGRLAPRLLTQPSVLLILAGIVGIAYFSLHLKPAPDLKLVASKPLASSNPQSKQAPSLKRSVPVRLRIASIGIDTSLQTVGLTGEGSLQVPADPFTAGWYEGSPTPGEIGPSIIDGHVDRVGGTAVFWRLRELKPGDVVEIDRADGSTARFVVDSLQQFSQDNFPARQVYGNIGYAGLRLITCGGTFNTLTRHYSDNIIVFGHLSDKQSGTR